MPPKESCSIVTNLSLCSIAASEAEKPAGPAPTMTTSTAEPFFGAGFRAM